jgi:protein dithiol oxidoreductase (disulfide-forming)
VSKSFSIDTRMKRADELVKDYGVDGTPTIIVDGKYRVSNVSAGGFPNLVELTQWLVAKERAGK